MTMSEEIRKHLLIALEPEEAKAEPLVYLPNGTYLCGCPWVGYFVPHFCPIHPGACVVFEIREPRS